MADRGAYEFTDSAPEAPVISPSGGTYTPPLLITLSASEGDIYYTLDGTEPTSASTLYTEPFYIDGTVIMSIVLVSGVYSAIMSGSFEAYPPNFILSGGYWIRDISKFETSASNYEDKPSLQDILIDDIVSISGNVNVILTSAHGAGQWDAISTSPVVLSADQPYYPAALQSTLLAGIDTITGSQAILITKVDNVSGNQMIIITKVDNISAGIVALGTPMQSGTPVTLAANQPLYPAALEPTLVGIGNLVSGADVQILQRLATLSADVWNNPTRELTSLSGLSVDMTDEAIASIRNALWNTTLEYVDETDTTRQTEAWIMLQAIFSTIKQRLKRK